MLARNLCLFRNCLKYCSISSHCLNGKHINQEYRTFANTSGAFPQDKNITTNYSYLVKKKLHETKQRVKEGREDQSCNSFTYRTHSCGELRPNHEGKKVTLCGWVQYSRLSKFLLLRDAYGLTQCVVNNDSVNLTTFLWKQL